MTEKLVIYPLLQERCNAGSLQAAAKGMLAPKKMSEGPRQEKSSVLLVLSLLGFHLRGACVMKQVQHKQHAVETGVRTDVGQLKQEKQHRSQRTVVHFINQLFCK